MVLCVQSLQCPLCGFSLMSHHLKLATLMFYISTLHTLNITSFTSLFPLFFLTGIMARFLLVVTVGTLRGQLLMLPKQVKFSCTEIPYRICDRSQPLSDQFMVLLIVSSLTKYNMVLVLEIMVLLEVLFNQFLLFECGLFLIQFCPLLIKILKARLKTVQKTHNLLNNCQLCKFYLCYQIVIFISELSFFKLCLGLIFKDTSLRVKTVVGVGSWCFPLSCPIQLRPKRKFSGERLRCT